ncbi:MAG: hypothetical protein EOO73_30920 [Myxococcales bacterium]|nr:MAG: hypothetical protein EOO73_30920 [Myxococcales bacterium]
MKLSLLLLPLLALACVPSSPSKSPTNDVTPPTTNTGDGEVMGADRVAPAQKLDQGPKLDSSEGLQPAPKPAGE